MYEKQKNGGSQNHTALIIMLRTRLKTRMSTCEAKDREKKNNVSFRCEDQEMDERRLEIDEICIFFEI